MLGKSECHISGAALCLIQKGNIIIRVVWFVVFFPRYVSLVYWCTLPFYCEGKLGKSEGNQMCSGHSICSKRVIWRRVSLLGGTL